MIKNSFYFILLVMNNKWMILQCRKCESVICIEESKRTKLKDLDCPYCWEENYQNRLIIWERKKHIHDIDDLIKKSKEEE